MSNSNTNHIDCITHKPEESAAESVDKILESICDGQLKVAMEIIDDDPERGLMAAAILIETNSRIEGNTNIEPPTHFDPSDAFKDDIIAEATDNILEEYADDLYYSANQMSGDNREQVLEIVGELDSRIGGGY